MKSNTPKFASASSFCIADTPCANGYCYMIQQSASYRRSTLKIYVNHCLLVLGVLSARFVFVNRCCLKAVSRSLSTLGNLHLNCSTSKSWCNALGRAGRMSSPGITYLPLFFKQQAKNFVFFCLPVSVWAKIFSLVMLVLVFVCYLVFRLTTRCVSQCVW